MTDHWKDVRRKDYSLSPGYGDAPDYVDWDFSEGGDYYSADDVDAARAKDAAEIAALKQYIAQLEAELDTEDV